MNLAMLLDLPSMIVPDDIVVIDVDGREVTYLELRQAASQVAGMLRGLGVGEGDRVGAVRHQPGRHDRGRLRHRRHRRHDRAR